MEANNVITNSIIYRSSCWGWLVFFEKMMFFEIVALHSCQQMIRRKHLLTTCDFNKLCSRSVALQPAAIWKKQNYSPVLFKNFSKKKSKHLLSTTFYVDCFRYTERITEGKFKCLLHTALISNDFFDENKDKRKRYSLSLKERNGRFSIY